MRQGIHDDVAAHSNRQGITTRSNGSPFVAAPGRGDQAYLRDMEMGYHLNFRDPDAIALVPAGSVWLESRADPKVVQWVLGHALAGQDDGLYGQSTAGVTAAVVTIHKAPSGAEFHPADHVLGDGQAGGRRR